MSARRSDGKLPPHVMVYFAIALALFAAGIAVRQGGRVAGLLTRGAFLRDWRLMAIDGFELDVPDTADTAAFGYPAGAREHPAFPKVRVVTIGECGSHAKIAARIGPVGGKGASEQALARRMFGRLEEGWLLIADRGFRLAGLAGRRRHWRRAAVEGESRPSAAGAGVAARRFLPVGGGPAHPA